MDPLVFSYTYSQVTWDEIKKISHRLNREINRLNNVANDGVRDPRASINLCLDIQGVKKVKLLIREKKKLHPHYIIVIGIGGSNLGTMAIQEAIVGKLYNQGTKKPKMLFVETVDPDNLDDVCGLIEPVLKKNENILINVVSKSGTTTETIANALLLINLLKKYKNDYQKYIVITTDKDTKLWKLAKELGLATLEIPREIGGRYSVFTPVGLFPLGLLDINISLLLKGACLMRKKCLSQTIKNNPAILSAINCYIHYQKGRNINDLFLFSVDFEFLGKWYRQLMAESLGKEYTLDNEKKPMGITPTVSIGSTDLHSMAQLYLGGPQDKLTTFVSLKQHKKKPRVPSLQRFSNLVKNIEEKTLQGIMDAILNGVKIAYRKQKRPFMEIVLPDKSEASLGQFLQFKMMEIMYLGHLMNIDPFNQPQVEKYKRETRILLTHKKTQKK